MRAKQASNVGRWTDRYRDLDPQRPQSYGDAQTYVFGAQWLKGCNSVEDWGAGMGGFRPHMLAVNPSVGLIGIDGSVTPFASIVADLVTYKSSVEGIFMRHVLEHDPKWAAILDNALSSFTKRMALVIFTPMQETTRELAWNGIGVPDIGFEARDLTSRFEGYGGIVFKSERLRTVTQYGEETMFLLSKEGAW